jgi:hypothetical protein
MMSDGAHLTTWITREAKERFAAIARHQGLSDSALLKRLVDLLLRSTNPASYDASAGAEPEATRSTRLTVRLRPDDEILLRARAAARAANQGERAAAPGRDDLRALLRVCEGLRDHVKGLIAANLNSWERGHAD